MSAGCGACARAGRHSHDVELQDRQSACRRAGQGEARGGYGHTCSSARLQQLPPAVDWGSPAPQRAIRGNPSAHISLTTPPPKVCAQCGATSTPQWREGPLGPGTLCNRCGVKHARMRRSGRHPSAMQRGAGGGGGGGKRAKQPDAELAAPGAESGKLPAGSRMALPPLAVLPLPATLPALHAVPRATAPAPQPAHAPQRSRAARTGVPPLGYAGARGRGGAGGTAAGRGGFHAQLVRLHEEMLADSEHADKPAPLDADASPGGSTGPVGGSRDGCAGGAPRAAWASTWPTRASAQVHEVHPTDSGESGGGAWQQVRWPAPLQPQPAVAHGPVRPAGPMGPSNWLASPSGGGSGAGEAQVGAADEAEVAAAAQLLSMARAADAPAAGMVAGAQAAREEGAGSGDLHASRMPAPMPEELDARLSAHQGAAGCAPLPCVLAPAALERMAVAHEVLAHAQFAAAAADAAVAAVDALFAAKAANAAGVAQCVGAAERRLLALLLPLAGAASADG